jgi:hypothetical protein
MNPTRLLLAAALAAPALALAQAPAKAPPLPANAPAANPHSAPASPWGKVPEIVLTLKVPPKGDTGTWRIRTFDDPADIQVELDTPAAKGRTKGTLLLVAGAGIAVKGFVPEKGFEIDPLDGAVVHLRLLTKILTDALPNGPEGVTGTQAVNLKETQRPLVAFTPSLNLKFDAPWAVTGKVTRKDAQTLTYDLTLETAGAKAGERVKFGLAGTLGGKARERWLDDGMALAGFTAYRLGAGEKKGNHATLSFGATKLAGPFKTVKDLRAELVKKP